MDDQRQDLLAQLMPLSRMLRKIEDAAAARHGISMWQYAILAVAERVPGSNQAEVAETLSYSKNRIVGDIDQLEAAGFLQRRPGADRRANVLALTAGGRRTMRAIRTEIHRGEDELLAPLSATARTSFNRALATLDRHVRSL